MQVQRETARAARKTTNYMGADATVYEQLDPAMTQNSLDTMNLLVKVRSQL